MQSDVIIVGAGPAGLVAGELIASNGFKVLIFEKAEFPGKNKICGGAISQKCFLDLKLPQNIVEKKCSKTMVHFLDQKFQSNHNSEFVLFQRELLERELANKAEKKGAKLLTSKLVIDVKRNDDKIIANYKSLQNGKNLKASAKLIIIADGAKTLAFKKFGLGFACQTNQTSIAATCNLNWPKNQLDYLSFFFSDEISPFGLGWIFPKKDIINVGVICLCSKLKQSIWNHLNHFIISQGLESREVINSGSGLIPQGVTEIIYDDSILVIGDAAGTADPIDGGGIYNAAISGKIAGEVAVKALETKKTSKEFLANYKTLWKKTENAKSFQRSYLLQRLALKNNINIGIFLKKAGIFNQYVSID